MERTKPTRFGEARRTVGAHGYVAYFPSTIPRGLDLPPSIVRLLGEAEASLGRLDGVGRLVPNPHLLVRPYLLREAVASTRIEGTQASLLDVFEQDAAGTAPDADLGEVLSYVEAMRWGLEQLKALPLSVRLLCGMHQRLMAGERGRERTPGEIRTTQNWIGAPGSTIQTARFVPPPPNELPSLLADLARFAHEEPEMPLLIQDALLHSQFETLHPFLDGNGRLGRLLLVFFLVERGRLASPLLYLSAYLERERDAYYSALRAVHEDGDALPWIELFLTAVQTQAADAVTRAARIVELHGEYQRAAAVVGGPNALALVYLICDTPVVTTRLVEERLGVSRPTSLRLLRHLEARGVLAESAEGARGQRRYFAPELMAALTDESLSAR